MSQSTREGSRVDVRVQEQVLELLDARCDLTVPERHEDIVDLSRASLCGRGCVTHWHWRQCRHVQDRRRVLACASRVVHVRVLASSDPHLDFDAHVWRHASCGVDRLNVPDRDSGRASVVRERPTRASVAIVPGTE